MTSQGVQIPDKPSFLRHFEKETIEPVTGSAQGVIPEWLQGELIRVGPGIRKIGNDHYAHVFDGLAVLHKFTLKSGKAFYQNRALQSDTYKKNMEANRIVVSEFGTRALPDPCQTLFSRLKSNFKSITTMFTKASIEDKITDNCCVNVEYHGDQLYCMTEGSFVRRIDPKTLNIVGEKTNISDYVSINTATAHPHVLEDGTVINMGSIFRHSKGPHYGFIKIPPSYNSNESTFANAKLIAEIPSRWKIFSAYFHSFGVTNSGKLIFVEQPFCMNLLGLTIGELMNRPYCEWVKWYPNEKTRFYVISMEDGKVNPISYETDELFTFHHINSYETDEEIIVDVCGYSDAEWVNGMTATYASKSGKLCERASVRRYVLPLNLISAKHDTNLVKSSKEATAVLRKGNQKIVDVTPQHFTDAMLELPCINYNFNGKIYRYFYGLEQVVQAKTFEFGMDTVNVITGEKISWNTMENSSASEPVFVQDPTKQNPKEDDGVVLSVVLPNAEPNNVMLMILNAKDMAEIARVKFTALGTVTGTLHGQWTQL